MIKLSGSRSALPTGDVGFRPAGRAWALTGADQLAPPLARGIVGVILTAICVVSLLVMAGETTGFALLLGVLIELTLLVLQLRFFSRRVLEFPSRAGYLALAVEAVLIYVPFAFLGQGWVAVAGFLAGNVLLALRSPVSWLAFALVIVSIGGVQLLVDLSFANVGYSMVSTMITGLVVYALSRLGSVVLQLQSAREEIARIAASDERSRIAQDLHDLLGYSLSAITLKGEVVRHLVTQVPPDTQQSAVAQLDEILELSRQALSDVRSVARDYRVMSVQEEIRSAGSVLAAAAIDPQFSVESVELPDRLSTVLATVVREAVTNILRHSTAERCTITMCSTGAQIRLRVSNDGAPPEPIGPRVGSGLDSLAARLHQINGSLDVTYSPPDLFVLQAGAPLWTPAGIDGRVE